MLYVTPMLDVAVYFVGRPRIQSWSTSKSTSLTQSRLWPLLIQSEASLIALTVGTPEMCARQTEERISDLIILTGATDSLTGLPTAARASLHGLNCFGSNRKFQLSVSTSRFLRSSRIVGYVFVYSKNFKVAVSAEPIM